MILYIYVSSTLPARNEGFQIQLGLLSCHIHIIQNRSMESEPICPNIEIIVNAVFDEILVLRRVMNILNSKEVYILLEEYNNHV